MYMYQLALALTLKYVAGNRTWAEVADTQFFAHFPMKCFVNVLAQVYMAPAGSVPLAGLYVFPHGALL